MKDRNFVYPKTKLDIMISVYLYSIPFSPVIFKDYYSEFTVSYHFFVGNCGQKSKFL